MKKEEYLLKKFNKHLPVVNFCNLEENDSVFILDIPFFNSSFEKVIKVVENWIKTERKSFIVTANPEIVMHASIDPDYKNCIKCADLILPDGYGVILASRILNCPLFERIAGFDLMMELLRIANEKKWRIYFLGGKEKVKEKAVINICKMFPYLNIVGSHHGYFEDEEVFVKKEIKALAPDLVFVAMGFPKQEKWICDNIEYFSKGVFIGVGGSLDVLAGEVKRAPEFWRNMNLEWLYRLIQQPSRWRRMLALPRFMIKVLKVKWGK